MTVSGQRGSIYRTKGQTKRSLLTTDACQGLPDCCRAQTNKVLYFTSLLTTSTTSLTTLLLLLLLLDDDDDDDELVGPASDSCVFLGFG